MELVLGGLRTYPECGAIPQGPWALHLLGFPVASRTDWWTEIGLHLPTQEQSWAWHRGCWRPEAQQRSLGSSCPGHGSCARCSQHREVGHLVGSTSMSGEAADLPCPLPGAGPIPGGAGPSFQHQS